MRPTRTAVAVLLATAPLFLATPALAHGGHTPFANCTEAYENGHSNIPSDSPHFKSALDGNDKNGVGCENPPANFTPVPADREEAEEKVTVTESDSPATDKDLAETGGSSATPYIATAGGVLLLGGGALALRKRRRM
jgi:LPXTG-motif cell wall-anchored protein